MHDHSHWMQRCLALANNGAASAAPNPMVGAVLVHEDRILAEGWHQHDGGPHAEVNCLRAFGDAPVPHGAVLYVNLEPCAHHGRTPPCADLLIARRVKRVVIAHSDPHPAVSGRGVERLEHAGVRVINGIEEMQARWLNRRFLASVMEQRPYIILKWARSADGYLDRHPRSAREVQRISSQATDVLVHRWRSEEQAILVGSRTVVNDNPRLTVRHVEGRSPLRLVIDRQGIIPSDSSILDGSAPTLVFTAADRAPLGAAQSIAIEPDITIIEQVLAELQRRSIRSLLVEGGAEMIGHFIASGLWDEARMVVGEVEFGRGTPSPTIVGPAARTIRSGPDHIHLYVNTTWRTAPLAPWHWC
ncbi:MAG: bifunctional diaminohydroxyphosphoribosylaminopyrimidine deaminase/5-amino-6-(5-phosphoribosylamino)uracil reductase RibD [Flavobacteriales bacterium]|nr:bifunctional diaminohydroxyphosphoribosylaminopyrimidine deaminase/5-amino-6-(5-phosphoribosylamino)uracil reductase RibD [Flavobacteriales bacterium]